MEMFSIMGRKRSNVVKGSFTIKSNGDDFLDCVTLGTKKFWIPQYVEDEVTGKVTSDWAEITASRVINRDPARQDEDAKERRAMAREKRMLIFTPPPLSKWCDHCAEWINRLEFAENKSRRDGLQKWCKACSNRHARKMYYLAKELAKAA